MVEGGIQLYKKNLCYINGLLSIAKGHFSCKPYKMLPHQFLISISILLEVFSQLVTCQLPPELFKKHPCTRGRQTGHRNWTPDRPQKQAMGKQTKQGSGQ